MYKDDECHSALDAESKQINILIDFCLRRNDIKDRLRKKGRFYRINHYIPAGKVRVISEKGDNLGILSKEEALRLAQEKGLDLVEIAPGASPPVCKIIDFKKFKYEQFKKQKQSKRSKSAIKVIRISLFIAEHDFQRRVNRAKKFLQAGETVKFRLLFRGRQIAKKNLGLDLFKKAQGILATVSKVSQPATAKNRVLEMVLKPAKISK